jgi:uncharacterized protein YfcZ (UPF0381/DUF406 family)
VTNTDLDVTKINLFVSDAWRAGRQPNALADAVTIGEQITELIHRAIGLIGHACTDVETIVHNANLRCQTILDQLYDQINRLDPVLSRLRAASKAVRS